MPADDAGSWCRTVDRLIQGLVLCCTLAVKKSTGVSMRKLAILSQQAL